MTIAVPLENQFHSLEGTTGENRGKREKREKRKQDRSQEEKKEKEGEIPFILKGFLHDAPDWADGVRIGSKVLSAFPEGRTMDVSSEFLCFFQRGKLI